MVSKLMPPIPNSARFLSLLLLCSSSIPRVSVKYPSRNSWWPWGLRSSCPKCLWTSGSFFWSGPRRRNCPPDPATWRSRTLWMWWVHRNYNRHYPLSSGQLAE